MDLKSSECVGVDWLHVTEDMIQWWVLVNTVMYLRVPYKAGNILTS